MGEYPDNLYYTRTHEWAKIDGDVVTVGITSYAAEELGEVTRIVLPEVGKKVQSGEPFGEIESYKSCNELFSPVSGVIIEKNMDIEDPDKGGKGRLDLISEDPYGRGWLIKIKATNLSGDIEKLMTSQEYSKMIEQES